MAANYRGKNVNRELQAHIILGGDHKTGIGIASDLDDSLINLNDPMEFGGSAQMFEGQSAEEVQSANLAQAAMLTSGYQEPTSMIDMDSANENADEASKGMLPNGPRNTGDYNGRY